MVDILVTGGLGFIGSHTVVCLLEAGYRPVILDNLSNSELQILEGIEKITEKSPVFFKGDINDKTALEAVFSQFNFEAVIHFAAYKAVGESVEVPLKYYENNVSGLIQVLQAMKNHSVNKIVFSSSCTVYGEPDTVPVSENESIKPATSPYGATKQMCETILKDCTWVETQCLRYFNPVGAHPSGLIGELPLGVPNNLVPYITQTAAGKRDSLTIHGGTYSTPDGTCIRDYIHVVDLAEAHLAALNRMLDGKTETYFEVYNVGTGVGYSVLEVVKSFEKVNEVTVPYIIGPKRAGDVIKVWSNTERVNSVLHWKARLGLDEMLKDAWNWQKHLSNR